MAPYRVRYDVNLAFLLDLDTGFIGSPSPASSANTSIEAAPVSNGGPLYPSTSEMTKNVAILSGAITVSRTPQINNQGRKLTACNMPEIVNYFPWVLFIL